MVKRVFFFVMSECAIRLLPAKLDFSLGANARVIFSAVVNNIKFQGTVRFRTPEEANQSISDWDSNLIYVTSGGEIQGEPFFNARTSDGFCFFLSRVVKKT